VELDGDMPLGRVSVESVAVGTEATVYRRNSAYPGIMNPLQRPYP